MSSSAEVDTVPEMLTLFDSVSSLNEFKDEATYRLSGKVDLDGGGSLSLKYYAGLWGDAMGGSPMLLAGVGPTSSTGLFERRETPRLKNVDVTVDLLPDGVWPPSKTRGSPTANCARA